MIIINFIFREYIEARALSTLTKVYYINSFWDYGNSLFIGRKHKFSYEKKTYYANKNKSFKQLKPFSKYKIDMCHD